MAEKKVQVENKNILNYTSEEGNVFVIQKTRPMVWLGIMDEVENSGKSNTTMYTKVLDNLVVSPKKTVDEFESFSELEEVVKAAIRFQRGK